MSTVGATTSTRSARSPRLPMLRVLEANEHSSAREGTPRSSRVTAAERSKRDGARLLGLTAALTCFGLVMVLSASSVASLDEDGTPWSVFERQVMWAVIGFFVLLAARRVDLDRLRRLSMPMLLVTVGLLVAVLAPGVGSTEGGSSRWIGFGPLTIQPSEFAKVAFVIFIADLIARREHLPDQNRSIVRPVGIVLIAMAVLILKQPDMGTAVVLVLIAGSVLYAAGIDRRLLVTVLGAVSLVGAILMLVAPYRRERFFAFLHPFANPTGTGYQLVQGLVALGSGHLTGSGVGGSTAKYFLPNAWTDYIFAIVGNELGFVGSIVVLAAFVAFAVLGIRIAARAKDRFSALLAVGLTCFIVAQAFVNIGGVESVLPETGIPLPFLSSGGSSLVVALASVGLLANIARRGGAPKPAAAPARTPRRSAQRTARH